MGIKDIFKRIKNKNPDIGNMQNNNNYSRCILTYKSGIKADILFENIEDVPLDDGTTKSLQSVIVNYDMPDGRFQGKKYYMEPVFDKDGNNITDVSYISLMEGELPLLKGFFAKEQLDKEPTNYIGYIDYNKNGKPIRGKDSRFEGAYRRMLYRQKLQKQRMDDDRFKRDLQEKVESIETHIKTSHAEDLSKVPCPYPNRNSNNNFYR